MLLADIHILHQSDIYKIVNYTCHCTVCSISDAEYSDNFSISFVKKGFFEYRTFRRNEEVHTGRILISKPGYEHTTRHIDQQPDITTTIEFKKDFFRELCEKYDRGAEWFFTNYDIHSILVSSNAELEYLYYYILKKVKVGNTNTLELDELVVTLLEKIINILINFSQPGNVADSFKKYHLVTAELARDYILSHFQENISLQQLAQHCYISAFHFSRIFKAIMNLSPHQFLSAVRLNHAKILLETTELPVTNIAFDCGFNSLEHFVTSYKKRFSVTPSFYRGQTA